MQLKDYRKKKVYYEDLSFLGKKKKKGKSSIMQEMGERKLGD